MGVVRHCVDRVDLSFLGDNWLDYTFFWLKKQSEDHQIYYQYIIYDGGVVVGTFNVKRLFGKTIEIVEENIEAGPGHLFHRVKELILIICWGVV